LRHRPRPVIGLILAAPLLVSAQAPEGVEVEVTLRGLREADGQVLACLTSAPKGFPDCSKDATARRMAIPVSGETIHFAFEDVPPGTYAISLIHDENANGKADMALFLPKEGFGFSRDAAARFGPPKFASAAFTVGAEPVLQDVRMRYLF